jgi:hypothetical protein
MFKVESGNELGTWEEGVGAEEYGPAAPTTTQVAVQTVRDIATSQIPMTSTTLLYVAGGVVAAYLLYQYMYASET